jgi:hypothetical protein
MPFAKAIVIIDRSTPIFLHEFFVSIHIGRLPPLLQNLNECPQSNESLILVDTCLQFPQKCCEHQIPSGSLTYDSIFLVPTKFASFSCLPTTFVDQIINVTFCCDIALPLEYPVIISPV